MKESVPTSVGDLRTRERVPFEQDRQPGPDGPRVGDVACRHSLRVVGAGGHGPIGCRNRTSRCERRCTAGRWRYGAPAHRLRCPENGGLSRGSAISPCGRECSHRPEECPHGGPGSPESPCRPAASCNVSASTGPKRPRIATVGDYLQGLPAVQVRVDRRGQRIHVQPGHRPHLVPARPQLGPGGP